MIEFIAHNMAPIMFAALVVFLLLGYPVAFSLAACGLVFFVIGVELAPYNRIIKLDWPLLQSLPERIYGVMNNDVLLAVPFFTFMGLVLERSGMAEDLLDTIGQLFGTLRGGLAYAVVFVGALLAATTGVVAASVISMGLISLPIMLRYGYDRRVASGVIAASGTLAQIIPPSLVLIVMADQLGRSVGQMYEGAFIPGLVLSGLYALYIFLVSVMFPQAVPGLPPDAQRIHEDPRLAARQGALTALGMFLVLPILVWIAVVSANGLAELVGLGAPLPAGEGIAGLLAGQIDWPWIVALAAGFTAALYVVWQRGPKGLGGLPRLNLLVIAAVSFVAAILLMQHVFAARMQVKSGADFVVLTLSLAVTLSFLIAITNRFLRLSLLSKMAEEVTFVMVPPLALIFLVLGTIFIGLATPTEGGAMGAAGAVTLAIMKRRLNWTLLRQATESTAKLSAFVVFILIGARVFSLTFYGVDGHKWVEELLVSLPGGQIGFLLIVNAIIFVLAFFLDFFELAFIIIPLIGPAAEKIGIDLIWFGVILGVNMQTSFMHPPFGFALFYLRSVAPVERYKDRVTGKTMEPVTTGQIYWGAVPFVVIQVVMVVLVIVFPGMVMHYKSKETKLDEKQMQQQLQGITPQNLDVGPLKLQ